MTEDKLALTVELLAEIMHARNEWAHDRCDHSMFEIHGDGRPGYEKECVLDAQFIIERLTAHEGVEKRD